MFLKSSVCVCVYICIYIYIYIYSRLEIICCFRNVSHIVSKKWYLECDDLLGSDALIYFAIYLQFLYLDTSLYRRY